MLKNERTLKYIKLIFHFTHNNILVSLLFEQNGPVLHADNTVKIYGFSFGFPKYVRDTLSLGTKNPVLVKIELKRFVSVIDFLLKFFKSNKVRDVITANIPIKIRGYIKKCLKQADPQNIQIHRI